MSTSLFVCAMVPIKNSPWVQWNTHIKPLVFLTRDRLHLEEYVCVGRFPTCSKGFITMIPFTQATIQVSNLPGLRRIISNLWFPALIRQLISLYGQNCFYLYHARAPDMVKGCFTTQLVRERGTSPFSSFGQAFSGAPEITELV